MDEFKCSDKYPLCAYDFTLKTVQIDHCVLNVPDLHTFLKDDFYDSDKIRKGIGHGLLEQDLTLQ